MIIFFIELVCVVVDLKNLFSKQVWDCFEKKSSAYRQALLF